MNKNKIDNKGFTLIEMIVVMSLIAIMFTLRETLGVVGSTTLSFVLSFFITLIEVLVAFLQAYIFTKFIRIFGETHSFLIAQELVLMVFCQDSMDSS